MDEQMRNVNLLFVVDKIIEKLEGRKGVIDLDLDDELVNEIRLEMAETIRENYAAAALSQPSAQGDSSHPAGGECGGVQVPTDAERYQWLRRFTRAGRNFGERVSFVLPVISPVKGVNLLKGSVAQHLDQAIDAAILAKAAP